MKLDVFSEILQGSIESINCLTQDSREHLLYTGSNGLSKYSYFLGNFQHLSHTLQGISRPALLFYFGMMPKVMR